MAATPPSPPPVAAPPPYLPPPSITDVVVTSSEIQTAAYLSLAGGAFFLIAWAIVRGPLRHIYQKRTQITDLAARPPPLRLHGLLHRCFGYLAPIFLISDAELMQTAGLDALMLCRFISLGIQVFVPLAAICCAVLIPLTMTGTAVESSAQYANVASLMRYTLSNVEERSIKLWASFGLSYVVLAYTCYVLYWHYKSYAMLRLLHLRYGMQHSTGAAPLMVIVGFERRSWRYALGTLLRLLSPILMHRSDARHVRECIARHAAAELAGCGPPGDGVDASEAPLAPQQAAALNEAAVDGAEPQSHVVADLNNVLAGQAVDTDDDGGGGSAAHRALVAADGSSSGSDNSSSSSDSSVLPWWLPPERIPAAVSAELGTTGVINGKSCCLMRKRVLAATAHGGRPVWASAEQYAVLLTVAGPPPTSEMWQLLRPHASQLAPPSGILIHKGESCSNGVDSGGAGKQQPDQAASQLRRSSSSSGGRGSASSGSLAVGSPDSQAAGAGAEAVAAQLTQSLRELFPAAFTHLARVHNHKAADKLLERHEHAASCRDRCATAVAVAAAECHQLGMAQGGAAKTAAAVAGAATVADGAGGTPGWTAAAGKQSSGLGVGQAATPATPKVEKAAARLAAAEAELAAWQGKVQQLEDEVVTAQQAALAQPLGTAFIALFRTQTAAATTAQLRANVLASGNFDVRPCPGPDNINWPALWSSWGQRSLRGVAVVPLLTLVMIFPIGAITGMLSNLNVAVCGGTPATNTLYWPWYCQDSSNLGVQFVKELFQGILPAVLSAFWDTYVLPLCFYFLAQAERRHLALSDLDRRITLLFYCFSVFNTFLGSVIGGTVFQQIGSLVTDPGRWLQLLATALPSASCFFLNYIIIHALMTNVFRFIWPHDGTVLFVLFRAVGLFRPKCERDECMIRSTPSFRSGRHYGAFLLIQVMALSYAVIAPLVLPAAAIYYFTSWLAWRYSCLYFYERSYESGGRLFESLFTLVVWTLVVFAAFSSLVLASKRMWTAAMVMLCTQLPALYQYHRKVTLYVGHYASLAPLQATLAAPVADVDPQTYLPPPLRARAVGWYPEWGKVWEKYGISRYSW